MSVGSLTFCGLTRDEWFARVSYDPDTGIVTRRFATGRGASYRAAGTPLGSCGADGYLTAGLRPDGGRTPILYLRVHRLVYFMQTGETPPAIDHRDHDRLNNRWANLRAASHEQNARNQRKRQDSKNPYKGVQRYGQRYTVRIYVKGSRLYLGRFDCPHEAAHAYNAAALEHFGEFAALNEVLF